MTYGRSEDEAHKEELRREAEHDSDVARDRLQAQQKERLEAHERTVRQDIARLEKEHALAERDMRAAEFEVKQLTALVRSAVSTPAREAHHRERKEGNTLRRLQGTLAELKKDESQTESAIRADEVHLRDLRTDLADLSRKEHRVESDIKEQERVLGNTTRTVRDADDTDERARKAETRKEQKEEQVRELKRKSIELHTKMEALRRELSSH